MKNNKGELLPQPYLDLARMRMEQKPYDDAILGFVWNNTPEGYVFWSCVNRGETPVIFESSIAELEAWRSDKLSQAASDAWIGKQQEPVEPDWKAMYEQLRAEANELTSALKELGAKYDELKSATPTRNWVSECVPFQKCPVCDGYGEVRPIWNKDAQQPTYVKCSVCEGNKVILMYNAEAWAAELLAELKQKEG